MLEMLASFTAFPPARSLAESLTAAWERHRVQDLQATTRDAMRVLEERPGLTLDGARDVRGSVTSASLGGILSGGDLTSVAETLNVVHSVGAALLRSREGLTALGLLADRLGDFRDVEARVRRTIDGNGEVGDGASELLARVRREERGAQERLLARLREFSASEKGRQVLQEPFITTRDGRYVLAVKTEMRSQVDGLIHDISSSGATVFMEPLSTVELGNAWRELKLAERKEVERILRELSGIIGAEAEAILRALEALAQIDLSLAKARLAASMDGVLPQLTEPGGGAPRLRLEGARHPLLTGNVVATTLEIGGEFKALVISGPNTGGKTVALKTAGLLALMAQAGLAIPAGPASSITVFDGVYADIGDEQSIQQSLSTFSSHMGNIVRVLKVATGRSLVLLDELGAGTDPQEGSAIARAVLSTLVRRGVTTVVTSHHGDLKAFAHGSEGMENARMEFDGVTLAPTYKLTVGLPGRSNALAIAERLGLPHEIVEEARQDVGATEAEVDALLGEIQEQRRKAATERAEAERIRASVEEERASLKATLEKLEEEHRKTALLRRAEVQVLAEELRSRLRYVSRRVNALVGEKGKNELAALHQEMATVRRKLDGQEWRLGPQERARPKDESVEPGARVRVEGLDGPAEVVSGPDRQEMVDVQVGRVRVRVPHDRIKGKDGRPMLPERRVQVSKGAAARAQVGPELWVHGMRARQAIDAVDEYIEKASMAGHAQVRIIHGKGRWVLRTAIHHALGDHSLVGTFRDAEKEEGGEGVTIVEL